MRISTNFIKFALVISVALSCDRNNDNPIETISFDEAKDCSIDSVISKAVIIPLEIKVDNYPDGVTDMFMAADKIIVRDSRNIIFVYGSDGKLISDSSNKIGRGAGEHSVVTATSFNKYNNCLEVVTPV